VPWILPVFLFFGSWGWVQFAYILFNISNNVQILRDHTLSVFNLEEKTQSEMSEFTDFENEEGLVRFANMKRKVCSIICVRLKDVYYR